MSLRPSTVALSAALLLGGTLSAVQAQDFSSCEPAPEPVIGLEYSSRYTDQDAIRDTLDSELEAQAVDALLPLDSFIDRLARLADLANVGPLRQRQKVSDCVVGQLRQWAQADALSSLANETVQLTIGSRLSAFGLILWQVQPFVTDQAGRKEILDWLERRVSEQMVFWETAPPGAQQGNLRAWAALAAATLSTQRPNFEMRDWSYRSIETVLCTANPDGSIPQEMSRGKFALHYQLYAIAPSVTSIALLERQGLKATELCNAAIHRIVNFATDDLIDGAASAAITGVEQSLFDGTSELKDFQLAWIEAYLTFGQSEVLHKLAIDRRPLFFSKLGGNQTGLWGP